MENTFPKISEVIGKIEKIFGRELTMKEYWQVSEVIAEDRVEISKWSLEVIKQ